MRRIILLLSAVTPLLIGQIADIDNPVILRDLPSQINTRVVAGMNAELSRITAALAGKVGTGDARLTDARTPTPHAASHGTGQADAITPASLGAVATDDVRLSDPRIPVVPTASTLGGVKSGQCTTATGKLMGYDETGTRICETDEGGFVNPMDSVGQIIYGGAGGVATKLDTGTGLLQMNGASAPTIISPSKTTVGLDNVDNTSDAAKPISTATQTALDLKAGASATTASLALKADTSTMTTALALKAPLISPSFTTPSLGVATATSINGSTVPSNKTLLATDGSAASLTSFPTLNQTTTGTAAGLTAQYVDWSASSGGASIANKPTLAANTTATTSNFFTAYNSTTGAFTKAQPACADLSDAGTGCTATISSYAPLASPSFTTPVLGVATATSINKVALTAPATSATLTIANGATLQQTGAFVLNLTATATSTPTFPAGTKTLVATDGNVATATALAANGSNCSSGSFPLGVDASGAVETCTAVTSISVTAAQMPALTGDLTTSAGAVATTLATKYKTRLCEIHIWGTGNSGVLQDADDEAASCYNGFGVTETITAVNCYANAGSPTVTPIITGGGTILSSALTCGTASFAAGSLSGTPTLASAGAIDANITTAGGTATNIRLVITLTR